MTLDHENELIKLSMDNPALHTMLAMRRHAHRNGAPLTDEEWYHFALVKMIEINAEISKAYLNFMKLAPFTLTIEKDKVDLG